MATEFNYQRAWQELALPAMQEFEGIIQRIYPMVEGLRQEGKDLLIPMPEEVRSILEAHDTESLARLARASYYYMHWKPSGLISVGGWPVANCVDQVLRSRLNPPTKIQIHEGQFRVTFSSKDEWTWEEFGLATEKNLEIYKTCGLGFGSRTLHESAQKLKVLCGDVWNTKLYMDHKPDTTFDNDEVVQFLKARGFDVVGFATCNITSPLQPHLFTIGAAHMKSDSMYLRPKSAPCAYCKRPYDEHSHENALIFGAQPEPDVLEKVNEALLLIGGEVKPVKFAAVKDQSSPPQQPTQ